ncbi:MAG: molybdopterin-binding protein [Intestinimonas sp.]
MEIARRRADILITTGGLGPTCDDLTKQTLAQVFGRELVFDEPSAQRIRSYFQRLHPDRPMTENNLQQAMLPEGCTIFANDWGTAPAAPLRRRGTGHHAPGPPGSAGPCSPTGPRPTSGRWPTAPSYPER